ncbi:MAG: hypothetical protein JW807_03730 [Spirochaetes bacterium]|nr:hypothetical protein [Spirochaetota bacterium]
MLSLGIEFSTQSVKMIVVDPASGDVVHAGAFDYDSVFPSYGTDRGVLTSVKPELRHTSPLMMLEAIDAAFSRLAGGGLDMRSIGAVKVDAMQHCTVYAGREFECAVRALDPRMTLLEQLGPSLTRKASPIWEDRSTTEEARFLEERFASRGGIAALTGNRAELRFPAAQIMKWAKESPDEYARTSRIFLLSAFVTSVLSGSIVPVDTGDGWGTNLNSLDIDHPGWSEDAIAASDTYLKGAGRLSSLAGKLGSMCHYDDLVGSIAHYFTAKYGITAGAIVLAGTGDNPATLLGCGGAAVISLGSSYTVNGIMERPVPSETGEYNIFGYTRGRTMALSVITNGSKIHDHFMEEYMLKHDKRNPTPVEWNEYISAAGSPFLSPDEPLLLPYLLDESVPMRKRGIARDGLSEQDPAANIRALHLSQALSLRLHSSHMGRAASLCLVGGGSRNRLMKQLLADLFRAEVYSTGDAAYAAPLGCAISGMRALLGISYEEAVDRVVRRDQSSLCRPLKENSETVDVLLLRYKKLESE